MLGGLGRERGVDAQSLAFRPFGDVRQNHLWDRSLHVPNILGLFDTNS
jgi:hypothetical protein